MVERVKPKAPGYIFLGLAAITLIIYVVNIGINPIFFLIFFLIAICWLYANQDRYFTKKEGAKYR